MQQTQTKHNPLSANKLALYIRLSREDGDKAESLSVANQKLLLLEKAGRMNGFSSYDFYIDDGWTGTNFDRPAFQRMISDIENGTVSCVMVKDLSRLGRDSPKTATYIHEYFPGKKIRFIAVDDNIDKSYYDFNTSEDMMIDVKNMFNGFYPRDISNKVRSTFRMKQRSGQFIGAFACYGYRKSPDDHNTLLIDEPAAAIVRKIFSMYLSGLGQNTIAKKLNEKEILCPSAYKRSCGLNYQNAKRLDSTSYWTYSSVRNILRNRIYTGTMIQNKSFRQICKSKAIPLPEEQWIIVPETHEAIIDKNTFEKVQYLLSQNTRQTSLKHNIHIFAGLIKCGDCNRAMTKIRRNGETIFRCGSYHRYGTNRCSAHHIKESVIEEIILDDFNTILKSVNNLKELIQDEEEKQSKQKTKGLHEIELLQQEIQKLTHKKERAYDDYSEDLLSKVEYIRYKERYEEQISALEEQIAAILTPDTDAAKSTQREWLKRLLDIGHLEKLDRSLVVELVEHIYIYKNNTIKIIYNFSNELENFLL